IDGVDDTLADVKSVAVRAPTPRRLAHQLPVRQKRHLLQIGVRQKQRLRPQLHFSVHLSSFSIPIKKRLKVPFVRSLRLAYSASTSLYHFPAGDFKPTRTFSNICSH